MIPIRDDNPHNTAPVITFGFIGACVLVFLWQLSLSDQGMIKAIHVYGMIPSALFGGPSPITEGLWPPVTLVSATFLHGDLVHLAGNMIFLWVFGDNIEAAFGRLRYLFFFLLCGVSSALVQAGAAVDSMVPMVGASGALAGVMGAYLVLFPGARIHLLLPIPFLFFMVRLKALYVLGGWFFIQVMLGLAASPDQPGVAFWAHIGGFVTGFVLARLFVDRDRLARMRALPRSVPSRHLRRHRIVPGPWEKRVPPRPRPWDG